ncbi:isocitrate/isopropylmalate family dehydrogenase, partial [Pseudomonas sp.]|uniref:isocitrate/isopropylmalate family dehydrogenase n=1 Tax=Pseudomonas sp. TaxID=306 RepID=UPI00345DDE27
IANPLAAILSIAMMLRYSFENPDAANRVEQAVRRVLARGYRTADIFESDSKKVTCTGMGDRVLEEL